MTEQTTYQAVVATAPGQLELVRRPVPQPGPGQVRIRVEACGVCHSDSATVEGFAPGVTYPRVPGHEVVGRIEALGEGVASFELGQRVGVGFLAGEDGSCPSCRGGDLVNCHNPVISGITVDGGYAEVMLAEARGLVRIPDQLAAVDAAPLLCAGLTTYNALRKSTARAGDLVAIQGLGGLGHLGVQFARHMGFRTVVIARGAEKATLARELGAHHYIDARGEDVGQALQALGGAKVVLGTAPSGQGMAQTVPGLAARGQLVVVAVPGDALTISATDLIFGSRSVVGALTGTVVDNEQTLAFAQQQQIRPMIETFPLTEARQAYDRMMAADVRFRAVLVMNSEPTAGAHP
ncbi:alcohol dehydrogenase catalytic domain-containing protein [Pseudomonas vanderleydeniana]|uniref:Alcohol dehydrogenase catalytic domain-containing protein n=1 Tax=Pseudomonas vanderleydeniana TaxID=2745495 RepID=A0A9E6PHB2_9PSED|nr:alcohol dehydrogenase catalytic domain-containing protein [Pseudomonas vanderleydeniana]QXI26524.1 alcohol dehydrogenase catalytic domain-containing protein [Pseudomonas vanderleydeniana]